jgi:hypothetical protein
MYDDNMKKIEGLYFTINLEHGYLITHGDDLPIVSNHKI